MKPNPFFVSNHFTCPVTGPDASSENARSCEKNDTAVGFAATLNWEKRARRMVVLVANENMIE